MHSLTWFRSALAGAIGALTLLAVYFMTLTLVSGWDFTQEQFGEFWYFVIALAIGFGLQIALFFHLRQVTRHTDASGKVLAVSGATSTGAMIACCTHGKAIHPAVITARACFGFNPRWKRRSRSSSISAT